MSLRWHGVEGVLEALARLDASARDPLPALSDGAHVFLARSDELVPKAPKRAGDKLPVLVGTTFIAAKSDNEVRFGYDSRYAHWIHEHMWFKHPHGGQAKFLETAMLEKQLDALNAIGDHIIGRAL